MNTTEEHDLRVIGATLDWAFDGEVNDGMIADVMRHGPYRGAVCAQRRKARRISNLQGWVFGLVVSIIVCIGVYFAFIYTLA